jgi:N-methylhydantoinase A
MGIALSSAARFVHGTTRVTNALLERAGAAVAMITTEGFRDVVEMGRGHRARLYSVKEMAPPRLVERKWRFEVGERILPDGSIRRGLDEAAVLDALNAITGAGIGGVAVCFLHAHRNPVHERRVAELIEQRYPALAYSTSAEIVPEIGEYERFATTVLNVSVKPFVDRYLAEFAGALEAHGYRGDLSIMTSSGGVIGAGRARQVPMQLALSGPAGGVAASAYVARRAGFPNVITCDMGGTSTDVCLILDGQQAMTNIGDIAGSPNKTFQIEINTIGAGGGSIAWVDVGGELCIGPRSAGSSPGPACYGRGGTQPTTTDAHLVVGHLDPDEPLGGEVRPDIHAAHSAVAALAGSFGRMEPERLALGIIQLAVAKMTSAIKEISVARGHDPRDFVLLPFGGAGPMHATALADELGMSTVLIPPVPGNLSALGFVTAPARHDLVRAMMLDLSDSVLADIAAVFAALDRDARAALGAEGEHAAIQRSIGMRIKGQSFDLRVPLESIPDDAAGLMAKFRDAYQARYAYFPPAKDVEIVNCRVTALGPVLEVDLAAPIAGKAAPPSVRSVFTAAGWVAAAVLQRPALRPGDTIDGPAIIRESGATTVVGAGWRVAVDPLHNLIVSKHA